MINIPLDCNSKAQSLAKSNNPTRLENDGKKGYMRIIRVVDHSVFGHVELISQNFKRPDSEARKNYGRCKMCGFRECWAEI